VARRTSAKTLRRPREFRPELRTVVVFAEGDTEYEYVDAVRRLPDVVAVATLSIGIDPARGLAPLTLVNAAVDRLNDREVSECWCLFDVEWPAHHPHVADARNLARRKGVRCAMGKYIVSSLGGPWGVVGVAVGGCIAGMLP